MVLAKFRMLVEANFLTNLQMTLPLTARIRITMTGKFYFLHFNKNFFLKVDTSLGCILSLFVSTHIFPLISNMLEL